MNGSRTKLVIDLATDRIIWFGTVDFPLDETHIDGAAIAFYDGELPAGMRANNCWSYRFIDQKIVRPQPKILRVLESPFEASRRTLLELFDTLVDEHRLNRGVPMTVPDMLMKTVEQLTQATEITHSTQALRELYIVKAYNATTSTELLFLRDDFKKELHEI